MVCMKTDLESFTELFRRIGIEFEVTDDTFFIDPELEPDVQFSIYIVATAEAEFWFSRGDQKSILLKKNKRVKTKDGQYLCEYATRGPLRLPKKTKPEPKKSLDKLAGVVNLT